MNTLLTPAAARDVDFLEALKQSFIERTRGVHFALENIILDASLLKIEHVAAQLFDPLRHFLFLAQRRFINGFKGGLNGPNLAAELSVYFLYLIGDLHLTWVAWLKCFGLFLETPSRVGYAWRASLR